jgi:hypothetical protein
VRTAGQFQLSHPREFGPKRTLRFRFALIAMFNAISIWNHAHVGAPEGRSAVLDFVGMGTSSFRCDSRYTRQIHPSSSLQDSRHRARSFSCLISSS